MKASRATSLAFLSFLAIGTLPACNSDGEKTKESGVHPAPAASTQPLTVERSVEGTMRARVRAIDHATRLVTLEDDDGQAVSFIAGPQVTRLSEVRAGDYVEMDYGATLTAELRPPTPEEAAAPIAAVGAAGRADPASAPAAAAGHAVRIVTKVEAIDIPNMRVTLSGPMGDQVTVKAQNADNLRRLKIGDTIVLTYAEALVVSLDKVNR